MAVAAEWRPTVGDVAAVISHRTGDADNVPLGTFTAATRPTAAQVEGLIDQVQSEVIARAGGEVPDAFAVPASVGGSPGTTQAGHATAVGVASYVELNFFSAETTQTDAATSLWNRYQWLLGQMFGADVSSTPAQTVNDPHWSFPAAVETGYGTTLWEPF